MKRDLSLDYYPKNYFDSRSQFRNRAARCLPTAQIESWPIPSQKHSDLSVDVCFLPAQEKNKNLLILTSGVHGSESYTGAALQFLFMDHLWKSLIPENTATLLVHGFNPYGFVEHQRTTENHVNLNRNCSRSRNIFKISNLPSLKMCETWIPKEAVRERPSSLVRAIQSLNSEISGQNISMDTFIKCVGPGQFEDPRAIEFGGFQPEPQVLALEQKLNELIPQFQNIMLFDIHTGLGHQRRLHLLTGDPKQTIHPTLFKEILDPTEDHAIYEFTSDTEDGFYATHGSTNDFVAEFCSPPQRVCALTLEFGTLGHSHEQQLEAMDLFILAHQGRFHGFNTEDLRKEIERLDFEKSFPPSPEWRGQILQTGYHFFEKILHRLKQVET